MSPEDHGQAARRLCGVGFFATADDLLAARVTVADVVDRLRRDAPASAEPTRSARLALADDLEARR
jgi:hypothetical protein